MVEVGAIGLSGGPGSGASRAVAAKPSASGSARAAASSASPTASTPVVCSGATSSPLRTARPHSASTIAAVSVASTWSATAWVTL